MAAASILSNAGHYDALRLFPLVALIAEHEDGTPSITELGADNSRRSPDGHPFAADSHAEAEFGSVDRSLVGKEVREVARDDIQPLERRLGDNTG